jgi:hypothetical protein
MLVNEWAERVWPVLTVRPKTLHDYKRLYKRHLAPSIGAYEVHQVITSSQTELGEGLGSSSSS